MQLMHSVELHDCAFSPARLSLGTTLTCVHLTPLCLFLQFMGTPILLDDRSKLQQQVEELQAELERTQQDVNDALKQR